MPTTPGVAVVVPVKGGDLAKSRLRLPDADRRALADAVARDTVAAARAGLPDALVVVVTADPHVRGWAEAAGCRVVADGGEGLDAAVAAGVAAASADADVRVCVLLGDHPALEPAELAGAVAEVAGRLPAVVPDADGTGTALLVADVPRGATTPTRFGPGSAEEHRRLGYAVVDLDAPGLRTDVDDAASLTAALALGVGAHTRAALGNARGR